MKLTAALLVFGAVLLAACNPNKTEVHKLKPAPWKMSLETQPAQPGMNKDVTFRLSMTDQQGKPVTGAQVSGALVMSLMDMGKNEVKFSDKGDGVYEAVGKMDMAGPWDVVVSVKSGGTEGQKTFPLTVRE